MNAYFLICLLGSSGLYIISCFTQADQKISRGAKSEESLRMEVHTTGPTRSDTPVPNKQADSQTKAKCFYDELIAKARTHGSLRVIVQLRMETWKPEGLLPDSEAVEAQRETIAHLQATLLKRMASFAVTNIKLFKYVPHLAMEVDTAGLKDLMSNPDIIRITEDVATPPTF